MKKTRDYILFAIGLVLCLALESSCAPGIKRYNVLLVTLDTTRADYFSCYGYPLPTTPNFDRLAELGTRFDMAIAQAAVTPVSHASIFTGLNPYQHGLRVLYAASGYRLPDNVPTLATVLSEQGWQSGAFLSAFPVSEHFGFDRGFDLFDNGIQEVDPWKPAPRGRYDWDIRANQRRSDATTDRALEWLRSVEDPFFAWIHYWDPHDGALLPPREDVGPFVPPDLIGDDLKRAIYAAEVHYVDAQFGRVLDWLEEESKLDHTIIVVVADHGEGLGEHDWWLHRILYQEQIQVPLLLQMPGEMERHSVGDLVRTIDIYPTILEALGIQPPKEVEGRSLSALLRGEPDEPRIAYADQLNVYDTNAFLTDSRPLDALLHCAMDERWKLIYRPHAPTKSELFDLASDPDESTNLFETHPEEARRLLSILHASGGFVDQPFGDKTDPETLERLRSLGYID